MTKRQAAWRGAVAGVLCATGWTAAMTLLALALAARGRPLPGALSDAMGPFAVSASRHVEFWAVLVLPGSAASGALVGLVGRKLRARPGVRGLVLWLAFFVAVALVTGPVLVFVGSLVELAHGRSAILTDPLRMLAFGVLGTIILSRGLAIPLLLAAVTVERWTRPGAAVIGETPPP